MRIIHDHGVVKIIMGLQVGLFIHWHHYDCAAVSFLVFLACLSHDIRATMFELSWDDGDCGCDDGDDDGGQDLPAPWIFQALVRARQNPTTNSGYDA